MPAPSGHITAQPVQALLMDGALAGEWVLDPRGSSIRHPRLDAPARPPGPGAGYRSGSDRGSPNQGSTLLSKRVRAQIRSPVSVRT
jgi:hypothetical protein